MESCHAANFQRFFRTVQLEELLTDFFIKPNCDSLEDLRGRVSEKFRLVGLLGDETSSTFRYDQAARDLLDRSINGLTRDAFDKLCCEEKWLAPVAADQPVRMNVALRSFTRGVTAADLLEAAPERLISTNPAMPPNLELPYRDAWQKVLPKALADLLDATDDPTVRSILAVVAYAKGQHTIAAITLCTEDERWEMLGAA